MKTIFLCGLALVAALVSPPAAAQPNMLADAVDIPEAEWRAIAHGKTLVYRIEGELWAFEHYYAGSSDRVRLQLFDGKCLEGVWRYEAPNYCFDWEDHGTACFRHMRAGDDILILETGDDAAPPQIQIMTGATKIPLSCGPSITS